MYVLKFGGTSLRDAAAIRNVCDIVSKARTTDDIVVVVSAHAGVTDALGELADNAVSGTYDVGEIEARHAEICTGLGVEVTEHAALFRELGDLCRGISLVGELSPRSRDYVLSCGERLAARTVAAALCETGTDATAVDAFAIGFRTNGHFGRARLIPDDGRITAALDAIEGVPIVTGFIAQDSNGNITTLGRDGSDLSAAFLGQVLGAKEVQIWTDVDGVLTADPNIVPEARPIPEMSYDEAAELANHGGKVLHPASLAPVIDRGIPVRVLNTHRPESPGTVIVAESDDPEAIVRCIAHKRRVTLVNIHSSSMLAQSGFLSRIFSVFEAHDISVDMVSTSEVSVSVTLDNTEGLEAATRDLADFAAIDVVRDLGLVCVVGHGIRHRMGVPARVLSPLEEAGVEVLMISLGALKVNVSLVVRGAALDTAVRALHAEFFGS